MVGDHVLEHSAQGFGQRLFIVLVTGRPRCPDAKLFGRCRQPLGPAHQRFQVVQQLRRGLVVGRYLGREHHAPGLVHGRRHQLLPPLQGVGVGRVECRGVVVGQQLYEVGAVALVARLQQAGQRGYFIEAAGE